MYDFNQANFDPTNPMCVLDSLFMSQQSECDDKGQQLISDDDIRTNILGLIVEGKLFVLLMLFDAII